MNTWQMLRNLTDQQRGKPFASIFYKTIEDEDDYIICFLREQAGSIEFRLFHSWDNNFITDQVIIYPEYLWAQISIEEANRSLEGRFGLLC